MNKWHFKIYYLWNNYSQYYCLHSFNAALVSKRGFFQKNENILIISNFDSVYFVELDSINYI